MAAHRLSNVLDICGQLVLSLLGEQTGIGSQRGLTDALSGEPQFVSTVGWLRGRWLLAIRHISNGGLDDPNIGETMLLAGMRF